MVEVFTNFLKRRLLSKRHYGTKEVKGIGESPYTL